MTLYRRYAQCPKCHTIWSTHDPFNPNVAPIEADACPICGAVMDITSCNRDESDVKLSPGWHRMVMLEDSAPLPPLPDLSDYPPLPFNDEGETE